MPQEPGSEAASRLALLVDAKVENFFATFVLLHAAHATFSPPNTSSSNSLPHFSQTYSWMGMARVYAASLARAVPSGEKRPRAPRSSRAIANAAHTRPVAHPA